MFKPFIAILVSLFFALASLLAGPTAAEPLPRDDKMTAGAALRDIGLARQALEELHAGYDRYTVRADLDAAWAALKVRAEDGMTRGELYRELSRILAMIRCDHTKAEIPDDFAASRDAVPVYLPFRFKLFGGRMFATTAGKNVDLSREDEILAIDGEPVGDILADLYPLFPVDGDTDFVKEPSVSDFGEFVGPAFEHFYPFLREVTDEVTLTVRKGKRGRRKVTASRLTFTEYSALTGEERFSSNFADAVRVEPLGDDAAYLAVDTFINYRQPVDPDTIYAPIFERLKNEGRSRLILDLRQNGGGSSDAAWGLAQWVAGKPVQGPVAAWTRMNGIDEALKPYLETWDPAVLEPDPAWFTPLGNGYFELAPVVSGVSDGPLQPKDGGFDGELVVLTSTDNASGVTHLLATLKGEGRGTYIGEPTGGAATGATAGVILFLYLPESGIKIRVPLFRTVMPYPEKFDPRLGITPDIDAPDTRDSYFSGTDPALEAAKAYLGLD